MEDDGRGGKGDNGEGEIMRKGEEIVRKGKMIMGNERKGMDERGEERERERIMKKNGREKDRKEKEEEGYGKNNRIEIVPYSLHFFYDFSPSSHHFP